MDMDHTRGQVIALANPKGAAGKSTLAGNLVWALATETRRCVLLELFLGLRVWIGLLAWLSW
jgi:septum formation inhibitor-activating ATPase MinD